MSVVKMVLIGVGAVVGLGVAAHAALALYIAAHEHNG